LKEILRKKVLTKIIKNTQKDNKFIKLRHYLHKWKDAISKGKLKDFKNDIFAKKFKLKT
jgi:hypothetical protein